MLTASLREAHPEKRVRLCFQDEARFGLKPTYRRRWSSKGRRPIAPSRTRYAWTYLYAVVEPETGEVFWLILPQANTALMQLFVNEYAASLPQDVMVVLVLDGAAWHTTNKLAVPPNIRLVGLPPYTPELNPAERLWHLTREATSNRVFADLDALEDRLCDRCNALSARPELIRSTTSYHGYRQPTGAQT
jgi:transposase